MVIDRNRDLDPTITISPSVDHLYEHLDFDYDSAHRFYDTIDKPGKPPLSDVHIHFSGANFYNSGVHAGGHFVEGPIFNPKWHGAPELVDENKHLIIMFMGGHIYTEIMYLDGNSIDTEVLNANINLTLTHELTHLGQSDPIVPFGWWTDRKFEQLRDTIDIYNAAYQHILAKLQHRRDIALGAIIGGSLGRGSVRSTLASLVLGASAGYCSMKLREHRGQDFDAKFIDSYYEDPDEIEAYERQSIDYKIVTTEPRTLEQIGLLHPNDVTISLTPFSSDPEGAARYLATAARPFIGVSD